MAYMYDQIMNGLIVLEVNGRLLSVLTFILFSILWINMFESTKR